MSDTHNTKNKSGRNTMNRPLRNRNWTFTWNNPSIEDEIYLENLLEQECKAFVWQLEEGEEKTHHIQGCFKFENARGFSAVKKMIPKAHLEVCRNWIASIQYCQKPEGRLEEPHIKGCDKIRHKTVKMSFKEWLTSFQASYEDMSQADLDALAVYEAHIDEEEALYRESQCQ